MKIFAVFMLLFVLILKTQVFASESEKINDIDAKSLNYSNIEIYEKIYKSSRLKNIALTFVNVEGSGWLLPQIKRKIGYLNNIYKQCDISFSPVTILSAKNKSGAIATKDNYLNYFDKSLMDATHGVIIYLLGSEEDSLNSGGIAWRSDNGRYENEKTNSIFLYHSHANVKKYDYSSLDFKYGNYDILSHEIGHVVFDYPHDNAKGNLMSWSEYRTNFIPKNYCERALNF